jgi:hypothetical protein
MRNLGFPELLVLLGLICLIILLFWKIFKKAGFPGILGLVMIVPILNLIVTFWFAYTEWPVLRELNALRQGRTTAVN